MHGPARRPSWRRGRNKKRLKKKPLNMPAAVARIARHELWDSKAERAVAGVRLRTPVGAHRAVGNRGEHNSGAGENNRASRRSPNAQDARKLGEFRIATSRKKTHVST